MLWVYLIINCMYKTCLLFSGLAVAVIFFFPAGTVSAAWKFDKTPPNITPPSLSGCYNPTTWPATPPQPITATVTDQSGVKQVWFITKNTQSGATVGPFIKQSSSGDSYYYSFSTTDLNGGTGQNYQVGIKAQDNFDNTTASPEYIYPISFFTYQLVCPSQQWIQTTVGDVHANNAINTPGGP